ncbi:hypothetical protein BTO32_15070 [Marinobacter lutaoensis]|uniref:DNA 3'-5' helicase n=2 Tax=Marinobacter lutaoensis TaxID=135739 RepID=A0A1V2DPQ0_9GAMM|nr:hypothetical protein BTO32_15070 [Marinobacter lutaoensis]
MRLRAPNLINAVTSHSLAYAQVIGNSNGYAQKLAGALDPSTGPTLTPVLIARSINISGRIGEGYPSAEQLALATLRTVEVFQTSADLVICRDHIPDDALPLHLRHPDQKDLADQIREQIVEWAHELWRRMINEYNGFPISHDTYLKVFHLRGYTVPGELWILDEYQDTAPVVADIIRNQPGQKLYIGDPYQQIYGFRRAINALHDPIERGVQSHYLTDSFRYNYQIAGLASLILRALGERNLVRGQHRPLLPVNEHESHTVICRSNLTILARAGEALLRQREVRIEGGIPERTFTRVESALALYEGRLEDVRIDAMRIAGSWDALVQQVHALGDRAGDAWSLIRLIERYATHIHIFLALVRGALQRSKRSSLNAIQFITAHKSKGREFPLVVLDEDLAPPETVMMKLRTRETLTATEREALHLLYVAITRAELGLELPNRIKTTFHELQSLFGQHLEPEDHLASDQIPESNAFRKVAQKARIERFIRQHRRP